MRGATAEAATTEPASAAAKTRESAGSTKQACSTDEAAAAEPTRASSEAGTCSEG